MKRTIVLRAICACLFTGLLILLNACAALKTSPSVSLAVPEKHNIPMRVGYYLQPNLLELRYFKKTLGGGTGTDLVIGETMCNGVDAMLRAAFEDVIKLSSLDSDLASQKIKAVIIPEIITIDMNIPAMTLKDDVTIVKLKWTVIDAERNILWVDTITGEAHKFCSAKWCRREMMELAIQDQFQKALESILKYEWWK